VFLEFFGFFGFVGLMKQGPVKSNTLFAESNSINTINSMNPMNKSKGWRVAISNKLEAPNSLIV